MKRYSSEEVTDLETARRLISELYTEIDELVEENTPSPNEFLFFLDEEHANLLRLLFRSKQLVDEQDDDMDLYEVLAEFVSNWLEVQHDMNHDMRDPHKPRLSPSA